MARRCISLAGVAFILSVAGKGALADPLQGENILQTSGLIDNTLFISQSVGGGHLLELSINGTSNGAGYSDAAQNPHWFGTIAAGTLTQAGHDHVIQLDVTGTGNLFAIVQQGQSNTVIGQVTGTSNAALIQQTGTGHHASFVQSGHGNRLSIFQSM